MLRVIAPGALATVQDAGRPGFVGLGVPVGGAADRWSLAVANLLLGNEPDGPAVELTLGGFEAVAEAACTIGLAGADLGATLDGGTRLATGSTHAIAPGRRVAFGGPRGPGLRAYLSLVGGIDAPRVLGSASTYALGRLGGLAGDGRPIGAGDMLAPIRPGTGLPSGRRWDGVDAQTGVAVRVLPGPHAGRGPTSLISGLTGREWRVAPDSNRMGLRLGGDPLDVRRGGELASFGVVRGAIQVPPSGLPVVLGPDHQTIGGYPVPAVVIRADLDRLGQLRPGDAVRFEVVDEDTARAALRRQAEALELARRVLLGRDPWDELAGDMRG